MLYIKLTKNYLKELEKIKEDKLTIFEYIKYFYKMFKKGFIVKRINNGEIIIVSKLNKKTKNNLMNYFKIFETKTICISENLKDSDFCEQIKNDNIKILDGKWLYKYLINKLIKHIILEKQANMHDLEISVLVNNISEVDIENIAIIANECRNINIITNKPDRLKKLEEALYEESGIVLNITQNLNKSLIKSDIIINVNLNETELNKFSIPRKAIILNVEKFAQILKKGFDGINISSYKIIIPKKYVNNVLNLEDFNKEVLYESYLYKRTNPKNIFKQFDIDNLQIESLIGVNGKIQKIT